MRGGCGGVRPPPNNLITIVKSVPNCVNLRIKVNYSFTVPVLLVLFRKIDVEK